MVIPPALIFWNAANALLPSPAIGVMVAFGSRVFFGGLVFCRSAWA